MAPSRVRIPPSPLAQCPPRVCAHPRRGGRAVECGGLENRYPSLGGSRVQIPPPPLPEPNPIRAIEFCDLARLLPASAEGAPGPPDASPDRRATARVGRPRGAGAAAKGSGLSLTDRVRGTGGGALGSSTSGAGHLRPPEPPDMRRFREAVTSTQRPHPYVVLDIRFSALFHW